MTWQKSGLCNLIVEQRSVITLFSLQYFENVAIVFRFLQLLAASLFGLISFILWLDVSDEDLRFLETSYIT